MSDDDEEEDSNSRVEFPVIRSSRPVSPDSEPTKLLPGEELLPPEPVGKCPAELQEKISRMVESMMQRKINMNFSIQQRKQFRNPSIYEKLIEHLDIEELGTNYPKVCKACGYNCTANSSYFNAIHFTFRNSTILSNGVKNPITRTFQKSSEKRWKNEKRRDGKGLKWNSCLEQLRRNRAAIVEPKRKRKENRNGIKRYLLIRALF